MKLEFMGYDGQYPQLCSGHLKFRANGKTFERYVWLLSGGRSYFDEKFDWHLEEGPWLDICDFYLFETYPELKEHKAEILKMINENVPHGCCGGCV